MIFFDFQCHIESCLICKQIERKKEKISMRNGFFPLQKATLTNEAENERKQKTNSHVN